jgi:hypothetical protein
MTQIKIELPTGISNIEVQISNNGGTQISFELVHTPTGTRRAVTAAMQIEIALLAAGFMNQISGTPCHSGAAA